MRQIFSNAGVSPLSAPITDYDLTVCMEDTSMFPMPVVGEEFFLVTLVESCEERIEVVRVIENQGGCLRLDTRGMEGTTPSGFFAGDYAYHAFTAGTMQNTNPGLQRRDDGVGRIPVAAIQPIYCGRAGSIIHLAFTGRYAASGYAMA